MDEIKVIEKLIDDTKSGKLKWVVRLNPYTSIILSNENTSSYCAEFEGNYFVIKKIISTRNKSLNSAYMVSMNSDEIYELTFEDKNFNTIYKFDNSFSNSIKSESNIQRLYRLVELKVSNIENIFDKYIKS